MTERANHKWWTLFAMCFALFMIMLDNTIVNVALPTIQRELHASPANLEWIVNGYVVTFAALILLGGKLGDRFGRKRMFIVGVIIFTICSALCALATTDTQLILFRCLQGSGAALMNPLSLSILVNAFPRPQVPLAIGVWAGISGLGIAIGPLIGGVLVEHYGWASVFWVNVPIGIIAVGVCLWAVAESSDHTSRSLDIVGTVLITTGLLALTYGLIKTNTHSWTSPFILALLGTAVVLIGVWIWWEARTTDPMVPLGFFKIRQFAAANAVGVLVGVALFGSLYFVTLYFQNIKGYSAQEAGVRSMPLTLVIMFVAPVAGRLNGKIGPRIPMTVGMLLATGGMLGLTQLTPTSSYNAMWPFFLLLGAGISLTMPSLAGAAMSSVDPQKSGVASGVVNSARQVGGAIGIAVLGSVVAKLAVDHFGGGFTSSGATGQQLEQLVIGGQTRLIGQVLGPAAQVKAADAFVHGMTGAMWVGAALTFTAAMISLFALRSGAAHAHAPAGQQQPQQPAVEL